MINNNKYKIICLKYFILILNLTVYDHLTVSGYTMFPSCNWSFKNAFVNDH